LELKIDKNGLQDCVLLAGQQHPDRLRLWYNTADLFCIPSYSEGCPNVLLEAAACGLPAVARRIGDIGRSFEQRRLGIVFDGGPRELEAAIARGIRTAWNRSTIVEHMRKRDWKQVAHMQVSAFQEALVQGAVGKA
jgi:glycosyltransferase involved in cell wall biosynthesis